MLPDYIVLNESHYPTRIVTLKNEEIVMVSTIALNDSLFDNSGQYISDYTKYLDDQIFFFVNEYEILLPDNILSEIVYQEALT